MLKEAAKAYLDVLNTQLNFFVGMSVSPDVIRMFGGDTEDKKSELEENFKQDSWAAKYNVVQLARLIKLLRKLRSNDTIREAVIIESDDSIMISIEMSAFLHFSL